MFTEMALTARRFALTVAVAGVATLGSVALAPTASAAPAPAATVAPVVQDGPGTVVDKTTGNGPDQFLVREHGRRPIFHCDPAEPKKHANKCIDLTGPTRF
jgi:hypothetical protein